MYLVLVAEYANTMLEVFPALNAGDVGRVGRGKGDLGGAATKVKAGVAATKLFLIHGSHFFAQDTSKKCYLIPV